MRLPLGTLSLSLVIAGGASGESHGRPPEKPVVLVGTVEAVTKPVAHCGEFAFARKARFRVEQVLAGDYRRDFVDVTVGCPEMFSLELRVGARGKLTLRSTEPTPKMRWIIQGELPKSGYPEYWLVHGEPVAK